MTGGGSNAISTLTKSRRLANCAPAFFQQCQELGDAKGLVEEHRYDRKTRSRYICETYIPAQKPMQTAFSRRDRVALHHEEGFEKQIRYPF
jgi:hypothetical protein